jgi:hypothetical protein
VAGRTFRQAQPVGESDTWTDCSFSQAALAPQQAESITGVIARKGEELVLKAGNATSRLDDQTVAAKFAGKRVSIRGTLNPATNTVHIQEIQPLE